MKLPVEEIRNSIIAVLTEMAEDRDLLVDLDADTRLGEDLGFSSVDTMNLLASIDLRINRRIRYEDLLVKDGRYIGELTPGQIADYVHEHFDDLLSEEPETA